MIEHAGLRFRIARPDPGNDKRFLYLGDDLLGIPLEVIVVDQGSGDLLVIHAMEMREKYRSEYQEAMKWRV